MEVSKPRVVIVGGGFAGLAAARALRSRHVDVVIVDKNNHYLFQPLLYQVATAALPPGAIAAPIRGILSDQSNCRVLMERVEDVDLAAQSIRTGDEVISYDYLVLATGFETHYFGNDSWKEHAPGLKTLDEAIAVRARFLRAFEEAEREDDPDAQSKLLTFALVGAGPTGVEMAAALAEIAKSIKSDFRRVDTRSARIVLLDFADRVLPVFPPDLSKRAQGDLERLGVRVMLKTRVTDVDEHGLTAVTSNGPIRIETGNVIWAAGVKGGPLGERLGVDRDRSGRVIVEKDLSVPEHPNVFVAGDLAHCEDPESDSPVPAVAQGAIQGGRFVGETIAKEVQSLQRGAPAPSRERFHYRDKGSMAIIGRNCAVAELGKFHLKGYPAFVVWALVHIFFLIGFRRKLVVFIEWIRLYFTGVRGARLITGEEAPGEDRSA